MKEQAPAGGSIGGQIINRKRGRGGQLAAPQGDRGQGLINLIILFSPSGPCVWHNPTPPGQAAVRPITLALLTPNNYLELISDFWKIIFRLKLTRLMGHAKSLSFIFQKFSACLALYHAGSPLPQHRTTAMRKAYGSQGVFFKTHNAKLIIPASSTSGMGHRNNVLNRFTEW